MENKKVSNDLEFKLDVEKEDAKWDHEEEE